MKYGVVPYVEKPVSKIILGTANATMGAAIAELTGAKTESNSTDKALELLDQAFRLGINTFDCAAKYGEEIIGHWVNSRGLRDKVVIISKGAHHDENRRRVTKEDIRKDLETSLTKLGTDYIDIYLLHRDDPEVPAGQIVEWLNEFHDEGHIGAFGGSNWGYERLEQAREYASNHDLVPFSVSSPHFGLGDQIADPWGGGCVTLTMKENLHARKWYQQEPMPVLAYSSLARGLFAGAVRSDDPDLTSKLDEEAIKGYLSPQNLKKLARAEMLACKKGTTVSKISLAWLFHQPENVFAVISASKNQYIVSANEATQLSLTAQETAWLNLEQS